MRRSSANWARMTGGTRGLPHYTFQGTSQPQRATSWGKKSGKNPIQNRWGKNRKHSCLRILPVKQRLKGREARGCAGETELLEEILTLLHAPGDGGERG